MFEWVVMGFFIGVPVLLVVGMLVAWIYHQRQDFSVEDLEEGDMGGGSTA